MVCKCPVCDRSFEDPVTLGAHRYHSQACSKGLAKLPAVVRRNFEKRLASSQLPGKVDQPGAEDPAAAPFKKARASSTADTSTSVQQDARACDRPEHLESFEQQATRDPTAAGESEIPAQAPALSLQAGSQDQVNQFSPVDDAGDLYIPDPAADDDPLELLPSDMRDTREFVEWVRSCNRNVGLPDSDVDALFALFRSGVNPEKLQVQNAKDVKNFEVNHLYLEKDGWQKYVLTREGDPYEVVLYLRDPERALRWLLSRSKNAEGFAYHPEIVKDPVTGERRVSTPQTAIWWENAQKHINKSCMDAVVAALICYSDQTTVSNDRRVSTWPFEFTLANIPMELRGEPDGHVLVAVFHVLKPVPGHPGFEPDSEAFRERLRDHLQESLGKTLQPLKDLSYSGFVGLDPNGAMQTFYPLLYSYVCDHPEGCKVTCTKDSNRTRCPCSVCLVLSSQLNDVGTKFDLRTRDFMESIFDEPDAEKREDQAMRFSVHLGRKPAIYGFNGDNESWNQPHEAVQVDILHQSDIGVFPTIMDAVILACMGSSGTRLAKDIEANLMEIRDTCRFADLRIPGSDKGGYLTSKSRSKFAGFEHRGIMQVIVFALIGRVETKYIKCVVGFLDWYMAACRAESFTRRELDELDKQAKEMVDRIVRVLGDSQASEFGTVKVHAISHLTDCIWRSGAPKHYSANLFEHLHIQLMKIGYRASNRRNAIEFMVFHHRRLCRLRELAGLDEIDEQETESPLIPGKETALFKALRSGRNELAGVALTLRLEWLENISFRNPPPFGIVSNKALELLEQQDELRLLYSELKEFLGADLKRVTGGKVHVHHALAVPPGEAPRGAKRALYARATPSFFKLPWYSDVAIQAEAAGQPPQDWHAEVRLFLSCHLTRYDGPDDVRELAFVRYFKELQAPDVVTGCRRLRWESAQNAYRVISVHNILRLVHIVPDFSTDEGFFINRFLFEH